MAGHCRESLDRWQGRWRYETARATVFDLAPEARESLAATVASYGAHFRHAAHHRLWQRLRRRSRVLRTLFEPPCAGGCRPNWAPPEELGLAGQWRYFHEQCRRWFPLPETWRAEAFRPWLLLLQVGREAEAYGDDARRVAETWPGHGGHPIYRRGLGDGLAWPLKRLPALFAFALRRQWHLAWVAEDGYRRRAGKRRVLRRLVIAKPNPQTEFAFHEKGRLS